MSHQAVLSFVQRNKIPRITQGRTVYYSRAHIDTLKGERESIDPNYYTYAEVMEKYHFSKDQVAYYIHNYEIDNHKHGRFTVINRKEFDRIIKERMETNSLEKEKERRAKLPKLNTIPDGYISVAQIAEKYGVTPKHVQAMFEFYFLAIVKLLIFSELTKHRGHFYSYFMLNYAGEPSLAKL